MASSGPAGAAASRYPARDQFLLACRDNTELVNPQRFAINRVTANSVLLLEDGHCMREHAIDACKLRKLEAVNRA